MCGIAGFVRTDAGDADESDVWRMLEALHHRGPDGSGCTAANGIAIGMRRLSIIDVAGGQQPIFNEAGDVAIVCNGEIYNHLALRSELERSGHRFRTKSDVEVILHLYEEIGEACFSRLNGMFGVAIADFARGRLVLARDAFGQKPLYTWRSSSGWAFASELKALRALPGFPRRTSDEALVAFLQFRYVPAPMSVFEGVERLPPGTYWTLDREGGLSRRRYFQIDLSPEATGTRTDPDGSLTRTAFVSAVERHLMSERPLGVFLSGGLDSSAVVAGMHLGGHRDIRTFTVGFEGFWDNELESGRTVARHFNTNHHEVVLDAETFWDSIQEVVRAADEPLADLTTVPLYHLARSAREQVVVVLSGEGADELLAGYPGLEDLRGAFDTHRRLRTLVPFLKPLLSLPLPGSLRRKLEVVRGSAADYLARTHANMTNVFPLELRRSFSANGICSRDVAAALEEYYRSRQSWDALNLYLGCLIEWWLPDDLLHKADRMTMAHSVELRCPFLDIEFARHCASLDLDAKVKAKAPEPNRKIALKKAFMPLLPEGFATRKKRGFSIPAYEWIQSVYRDRMRHEVERDDALSAELLPKAVRTAIVEQAVAGDLASQRRAWSVAILNIWADRWL